ncbi:glycosyl hydrolase family 28 protein [Sphingobacterium bambusae]|uniref:Glycosyl hydrolase family 28 protein n=1 Tax=Sphingobacterium bambusae TaxID=662858 RepID=A0ABW6BBP4_9SPHI|nr:glycosyl hydrolase family 28 protein [Sphingobacterium bambusae]WPL49172.1 glycosyl hydrolase family 28 protein [Sphingobacterium bambusae]
MKTIIEYMTLALIFFNLFSVSAQHATPETNPLMSGYHTPNMYSTGTQIERITQAIQDAQGSTGRVIIPAYDVVSRSKTWLIDRAILLPSNIELVLDNCTIKLSDQCRDNFIRSANAGLGITDIKPLHHIRIRGMGNAVLEGADNPRSTGDHNKTLSTDPNGNYKLSYGSDAGKTGENQKGGWRNHGIILAHVDHFQISGVTLKNYHAHGIVLERAQQGKIMDITFDVRQAVNVNGHDKQVLNQDGLGVRFGCKNIIIDNCRGKSGDDFINIGLTDTQVSAGQENVNVVSGSIYRGKSDDIANIYLQNWQDFYSLSHRAIRIMPVGKLRISNIFIDNMIIPPRSRQGLVAEYAENIQGLFVRNLVTHHPIISKGIRYASFRNILYHGQGKAIDVVPTDSVQIEHVLNVPE